MSERLDKRSAYLASCLLDVVEDENYELTEHLVMNYAANCNQIVIGRGIASMHYVCGLENIGLGERMMKLFLEHEGDPNVKSDDDKLTPVHVAAIWGREAILKMLLKHNGDVNAADDEDQTPIMYAIAEQQFKIVKIIQNHIFEQKLLSRKQENRIQVSNLKIETKYSKNPVSYNFDATSPYYVNITHRKKIPKTSVTESATSIVNLYSAGSIKSSTPFVFVPKIENIFNLTEDNLKEYSKTVSCTKSRNSIINTWREKVLKSKSRESILKNFEDIDALLSGITTNDTRDFKNTGLSSSETDNSSASIEKKKTCNTSFGKLNKLKDSYKSLETSFNTANEADSGISEHSNFIKSPKDPEYFVQMTEDYVHTDEEKGIVFCERKIIPKPVTYSKRKFGAEKATVNPNNSQSSLSTGPTYPMDYDTDTLKAELTCFGVPPGPVTKTTKKLYIKRLMKFKKDPEKYGTVFRQIDNEIYFSVELERTVRNKEWFDKIIEFNNLEAAMMERFQVSQVVKKWREGNLKTSFIYLLIDPRISENLPGQSTTMSMHDVWKRFLTSIFYVGKGKSSRPYSHLYDAIKHYTINCKKENSSSVTNYKKGFLQTQNPSSVHLKSYPQKEVIESKKLKRIIDIWCAEKGVVCLHIFHNILPVEAYTREAAIIEALSLKHLTNLRLGNFYGSSQAWTMRQRKQLGVCLLYKALQIFLNEGESQLIPTDLIS